MTKTNGPQCFVKDSLWVVNLVCKKEDSISCWFKTHQPRQGQRPIGRCFCFCFIRLVFFVFFCLFFLTDLKTSLNHFIPVHLTVISPHHRHLCFYFWTFVCSNCDIFHLLGTDKVRCKTTLAQNTQPLEQTALPLQVQIRSCKKSDDIWPWK